MEKVVYTHFNFKTKKAFKEAVKLGQRVTVYQPGPFGGNEPLTGNVAVEGPHYPAPHSWWAEVELKDGRVVKVS
jgi:hypothetical protein